MSSPLESYIFDSGDLFIYPESGEHGAPAIVIRKDAFLDLAINLLRLHNKEIDGSDYDCVTIDGYLTTVDNENI